MISFFTDTQNLLYLGSDVVAVRYPIYVAVFIIMKQITCLLLAVLPDCFYHICFDQEDEGLFGGMRIKKSSSQSRDNGR